FFATATCASFASSTFFSVPSFDFTVSVSPSRATMVPRTLTGGVWAKAPVPKRATASNAIRFIGCLREMGKRTCRSRPAGKIGAAIHMQRLPGDVAGAGPGEEPDRGGDLLRKSLPSGEALRQHVVLRHRAFAHGRDDARRDAIHSDARSGEIVRERLGEPDQARLRGDDVGAALRPAVAGHPADVDDGARAAPLEM